ncbi:branched-chain amino acid transport system substrate-binding protein [Parafrankia irregularis]|uniref:Branched-chain amino acid transport system substrate-binding protein n=1 Tax=Parafrankia irregularis TaxID=795642 RepID=A0A0S4QYW2_9ACTN|nr:MULTISPECIES: branched-chain amino acid ABC transporter substrate-binding protein [Parafrankia]MBE3203429.1 branched-chain amino acid ABC transporter substrate-binding protein [Parafrankia sp. CH37]CUU60210.1 branched-chain amino acid transport system substrate-binding protein [Parafrankia irregularis]
MIRRPAMGAIALAVVTAVTVTACGLGREDSPGDGRKTITIGFQGMLSGDDRKLGVNALYGVRTAVAEVNADASVPFRLKLVEVDDGGSPDRAPGAARGLVRDSDVVAVIGPLLTDTAEVSEPLYSEAGLLSVSPSATGPALTDLGFTTFYRAIAPDTVQGRAVADYISTVLEAKKVYSIDDRGDYGIGLSTALEAELTSDGVDVTHDGIDPARDYTTQAERIIAEAPDVVYYAGYYTDLARLAEALRDKGFAGTVMSGDGSRDQRYVTRAGADVAEGTFFSCACADVHEDANAADFVVSFETANGGAQPGVYSGEAYDATRALVRALRVVGPDGDRRAVARAFADVSWKGVTRDISFEETGELKVPTVYLYKVEDGEIVSLGKITDLLRS